MGRSEYNLDAIRIAALNSGLTDAALAAKTGLHVQTVARILRGDRVRRSSLSAFVRSLKIDPSSVIIRTLQAPPAEQSTAVRGAVHNSRHGRRSA
ncbi:MAG: helix-turn-helix transcriptional regulator [Phycisphaerales bacterium]|nr:helix-turn-helix transcriptional regulator [Phycisphaerales bacterium]